MAAGIDRGRAPLALTMGDPAGIGIEITLMAWRDRRVAVVPPFVLYADADAVAQRARLERRTAD
jgi:4-hydroxythreonine-4-phosphate dehydrogenase